MKHLTISFVDGKSLIPSGIIKVIERFSPWSHVEFRFGDETFGAQLKGGVRWRKLSSRCYKNVNHREDWEIPVTDEQYDHAIGLMNSLNGTPYDKLAILTFPLGAWRSHTPNAHICSGTIACVMRGIGAWALEQDDDYYDPAEIRMLTVAAPGARKS